MKNKDFIKIKDYEICDKIGEGGFSDVFKCKNSNDDFFAMKVPNFEGLIDIERFKREVRMCQKLNHENVMSICDLDIKKEPYFYTMPRGEMNLEEYLNYDNDERKLIEIIICVAFGLKHAHDNGVIHRDLKPQNVIIFKKDGNIVPKICDFGAGRFSLRDTTIFTQTGESIYSPDYCAPEQHKKFRDLDERSDIYSLGKIIYRIITGNNPLDYNLLDIPPEYLYIISKACQRDLDDRYQDVSDLIDDLCLFPTLFNNDTCKLIEDEIKRIENSGEYSKDNIEYLAKVLSISADDEVLDNLPNLPDDILRSLLTYYGDIFYLSMRSFDERLGSKYIISNEFVDKVSDFSRKISDYSNSNPIKCLTMKRLSKLSLSNGRFSAVRAFTYIVEENTKNSELMKFAKEILENSEQKDYLEQFFQDETKRILIKI